MIFKIFRRKKFSNADKAYEYLRCERTKDGIVMETDIDGNKYKKMRAGARVLDGNLEQTLELAKTLDFKETYTVGCLSFKEAPDALTDKQKFDIMQELEKTIFAGLDKQRYSIAWIEHTDKGRLELNFFIAKVDLATGKSFTPYYDKADRKRMSCFRDYINTKYNLTNPLDPKHRQSTQNTNPNWRNTPSNASKKDIIASIDDNLSNLFIQGRLNSRQDVEQALKNNGYTISRNTGFDNVSIKHPHDPKKPNIRLKGYLFEKETYTNPELKAKYIARSYTEAHSERLDNEMGISLPKPFSTRESALFELREKLDRFNTAKAKFINERYPISNDNEPIFPTCSIFPNSNPTPPSEWLSIDDVLKVSYDPNKNYTPLDINWDNEPTVVNSSVAKKAESQKRRDDDFDFGM